ncbi:hypothetical protein ebA5432 [Aromatoleum aromaticum EbN1]|uniref:Uncharacterized protein n=1 Tax=Aromatoleum aromaticum (strain DSM 19018 / LMG 30748 / EbN1) TaxID=76114 RepID=Q5P0F2_AROAE|nr:hypothetical protein ebA5432 [Aromatoleum aromaticum EbN1]
MIVGADLVFELWKTPVVLEKQRHDRCAVFARKPLSGTAARVGHQHEKELPTLRASPYQVDFSQMRKPLVKHFGRRLGDSSPHRNHSIRPRTAVEIQNSFLYPTSRFRTTETSKLS